MRRSVAESERMAHPPRLSGNYMGISRLSTTELLERGEDEYEEGEDEKEDEEQFLFRLESEVGCARLEASVRVEREAEG